MYRFLDETTGGCKITGPYCTVQGTLQWAMYTVSWRKLFWYLANAPEFLLIQVN
jgi:hypothetical protein